MYWEFLKCILRENRSLAESSLLSLRAMYFQQRPSQHMSHKITQNESEYLIHSVKCSLLICWESKMINSSCSTRVRSYTRFVPVNKIMLAPTALNSKMHWGFLNCFENCSASHYPKIVLLLDTIAIFSKKSR